MHGGSAIWGNERGRTAHLKICHGRSIGYHFRMNRYIAFLRGINLGKRRIKMEDLARLFEELKLDGVKTFIASGNVVFESKVKDEAKLVAMIEAHLEKSLGYGVDTFVRSRAEVAAAANFQAFSKSEMEAPDNTIHVSFFETALSPEQAKGLLACATEVDGFRVNGREFYWLCRIRSSDSKVWTTPVMRALKLPTGTMRNITTVRKIAALYPAS